MKCTVYYPNDLFRDLKKIYVMESVDYYTRRGSTTVIFCYKPWWKMRRKLKFLRTRSSDAAHHEQCPEAQAIIAKVKEILNPTKKVEVHIQEGPVSALKSFLPIFADTPRFFGWPTGK